MFSVVTSKRRTVSQQPTQRCRPACFGFPDSPDEMPVRAAHTQEVFCLNVPSPRTPRCTRIRRCEARTYAPCCLDIKAPSGSTLARPRLRFHVPGLPSLPGRCADGPGLWTARGKRGGLSVSRPRGHSFWTTGMSSGK